MVRSGKPATPADREFWQRLNELRAPGVESDRDFARSIGIPEQLLNNWKHGRNTPSLRSILPIVRATGVSAEWLLTGRGEKAPKTLENLEAVGAQQAIEHIARALADVVDRYGLDVQQIADLLIRLDAPVLPVDRVDDDVTERVRDRDGR